MKNYKCHKEGCTEKNLYSYIENKSLSEPEPPTVISCKLHVPNNSKLIRMVAIEHRDDEE